MNPELYLKIPSFLNLRTTSQENTSSPKVADVKENKEEDEDEEEMKMEEYIDIESPVLNTETGEMGPRIITTNTPRRKSSNSITPVPFIQRAPSNSAIQNEEKDVSIYPLPIEVNRFQEKKEDTSLIQKKMLTKEEEELACKIATQNAMIELGTQIGEKKFEKKMREKIIEEIEEFSEDLLIEEDEIESILKNEESIDSYFEKWKEENDEELEKKGIRSRTIKNHIYRHILYISYLKNHHLKKLEEKNEENEETIEENDEQMNEYIREIEEKEADIVKLTEKIKSHRLLIKAMNDSFITKYDNQQKFMMIPFFVSNTIHLFIYSFGVKRCFRGFVQFINYFSMGVYLFFYYAYLTSLIGIQFMIRYQLFYHVICILAFIQIYSLSKKGYEKYVKPRIQPYLKKKVD
jgi:hypothetical protein